MYLPFSTSFLLASKILVVRAFRNKYGLRFGLVTTCVGFSVN